MTSIFNLPTKRHDKFLYKYFQDKLSNETSFFDASCELRIFSSAEQAANDTAVGKDFLNSLTLQHANESGDIMNVLHHFSSVTISKEIRLITFGSFLMQFHRQRGTVYAQLKSSRKMKSSRRRNVNWSEILTR